VGVLQKPSENNIDNEQVLEQDEGFARFKETSGAVDFWPDQEPRQRKNLICILLRREVNSHTGVEDGSHALCMTLPMFFVYDKGIVCESVDESKKLFRRVGYFSQRIVALHQPLRHSTSRSELNESQRGPFSSVVERNIRSFDTPVAAGKHYYYKSVS
jgi:hypothetical protein